MKYILPTLGAVAAVSLFALSNANQTAIAVERPSYDETFKQLELFADVLARVRSDYVVDVNDGDLIENAINGMLQSLDPHSSYVGPDAFKELQISTSGEYGGLGMEVTTEDGFVKVIAPIDYITEIEGESIMGVSLTEAVDRMRGKAGEPITITIARQDEESKEYTLVREIIKRQTVKYEVKEGIGYIRIAQFNEKADQGLKKAITALKSEISGKIPGIVLDLRGNPGGLLDQSVSVSSAFLDGGEVVSTRGRSANDTQRYNGRNGELAKGIPLIILIDGASASASEIVAGAVQDRGRGLLVGMTSFGKGSVQSVIPLRGGRDGALRLTTQRYYTPSGRSIQGTGIDPDIYVSAIPDDGKDRQIRRESDLPNSIENEDEAENEVTKSEDEIVEIVIDYPPEGFEIEDDYQLQKAIEILKNGSYPKLLADAG